LTILFAYKKFKKVFKIIQKIQAQSIHKKEEKNAELGVFSGKIKKYFIIK
jgi:hypothetical protein